MLLTSTLAIVALLAATPAVSSAAVEIHLGLPANHGLRAHLGDYEEITLDIERKGRYVSYEVPGEVTETGLKVQFGKLGLIDVAFVPTETRTDEPPKGCTGKPSTLSTGLFVGTIDFTGEREYVRIEATQVKGILNVWRESEWRCRQKRSVRHRGAQRLSAAGSRVRSEAEKEPASLVAASRPCQCFFAAYAERDRRGRGPSTFVGAKFENTEGMEITRVTSVIAGASTFVFDHAAGTAKVRPPLPFSGHGIFKRRPHRRDLWRSTIRVPLLGADPLSVRGRRFRAALVRAFPGGE